MEVQRSKSESLYNLIIFWFIICIPTRIYFDWGLITSDELKSLEFAIENTNGETEKIKRLLQEDVENENYWKEQLKQAEEKKLASV